MRVEPTHERTEALATPGISEGKINYEGLQEVREEVPVLFIRRDPPSEGNNSGFVFANRFNGPIPSEPVTLVCLHCVVERHPDVRRGIDSLRVIGSVAHRKSESDEWTIAEPEA